MSQTHAVGPDNAWTPVWGTIPALAGQYLFLVRVCRNVEKSLGPIGSGARIEEKHVIRKNAILVLAVVMGLSVGAAAAANGSGEQPATAILEEGDYTVWNGDRIQFTKEDGADHTIAANQERITDSVWITRRNDGGQIFNIQAQARPSKPASPQGTAWAVGTTANLEDLTFSSFRDAVGSPKNVVGKDLVMFIIEERIFINVTFVSWSQEKLGGFSYERSTP